jgi:hypothetical protein
VLNEILEERVATRRSRSNPRGVKRKMSSYPLRPREKMKTKVMHIEVAVVVV